MSLFLVTGATGRHGGTGAYVARRLQQEGHRVRVLVRSRDERSEALARQQFDVHVGSLRDRSSLLPALDGVSHAAFCFPVDAGIVDAAASFSSAIREVDRSVRTVVMSMIPAQPNSPSHLGRAQWLAEEVMAWAGLDLCILRIAAFFYENIAVLHGASIREHGVIRNCFGEARSPWIAGEDAAELVVAAERRSTTRRVQRWLTERRIEHARELLVRTRIPLVDIASQAGFGDQAAFTRTFHRLVGTTPRQWRRDHGGRPVR
jgi:uncharacterized protein YbjT (DUF2867 family)